MSLWAQAEAIALCVKIEAICPAFGCHVALTGGLLYGEGERKDADIMFYRIRQVPEIDVKGLMEALRTLEINQCTGFGFCVKATYKGKPIDLFFPEETKGGYPDKAPASALLIGTT